MATGSALGPNTIDGCFQVFQDFLNNNNQFIYKAGLAPNPYISIATPAMQDVLAQAVNPAMQDVLAQEPMTVLYMCARFLYC